MDEKILIKSQENYIGEVMPKFLLKAFGVLYIFSFFIYIFANGFDFFAFLGAVILSAMLLVPILVVCIFVWLISKNQLVVTDKRVSGKAAFGKQIDLPIDSISSVGTIKLIKGLSISTSSGNVSFWGIGNRDEIYKVISDLIIARQSKSYTKEEKTTNNSDYIEELKKIKELLDAGVITQEEFDAKKSKF